MKEKINHLKQQYEDQVEGRNAVLELLESGKDINKIFITKGERHGSINKIIAMAKENKVVIVEKEKRQMEEMSQTPNYQGVIAMVPPFEYCEIEDILQEAKNRKEEPFILILDGIEDPHNLGSIIRTAETAGVHGIIIPKRRAAMVNSTVNKVSCRCYTTYESSKSNKYIRCNRNAKKGRTLDLRNGYKYFNLLL